MATASAGTTTGPTPWAPGRSRPKSGRFRSSSVIGTRWCRATSHGSSPVRGGRTCWARVAIAALVALAAARAWRLVASLVLAALLWAELLHVVASWTEVANSLAGRLAAQVISFAALAVGAYALLRVARDTPESSAPFVLIAAVMFVVAGGIGDFAALTHSQLPSSLPAPAVRALVAFAFGGGGGLAIAAARRLAPVPVTRAPASP